MTVKNVLTLLTGSCLIGGVMAKDLPQVLLLGDSVRIGYQKEVEARLAGAAQVKYPSVNCGSSEDLRRNLETYMEGVNPALVCLNAGLVDIHDLTELVDALGGFRPPPRLIQRRKQHRCQDRDDRDHDEEFNQRKQLFHTNILTYGWEYEEIQA